MDQEWLKEHVGEALGNALSAVVMAMPADPIEFLALWLLKHVQDEERKNKELAERDEIERRRAELEKKVAEEEMAKERARKEKADEEERAKAAEASAKQQRLEAYLTLDDERRAEIEADLEHEKEERVAKEAAVAEGQEGAEPPPPEDPIAKYRMRYAHRVKDLEVALSPAFIKEVGHLEIPAIAFYKILRAICFLLGRGTKDLDDWHKIRSNINDQLLSKLQALDATDKKLKAMRFSACTRALKDVTPEAANDVSQEALQLYMWIVAFCDLRCAAVANRREEAIKAGQEPEPEECGIEGGTLPMMEYPPPESQPLDDATAENAEAAPEPAQ